VRTVVAIPTRFVIERSRWSPALRACIAARLWRALVTRPVEHTPPEKRL
jgi:hypothetical protein